ncbi:MAG: polysaccharide pyruvyl transferase family protein [Bacteroidales bacterium]|nr:polysaccharide pyruvyl transferase family protein [Bacteroidales bacterium]
MFRPAYAENIRQSYLDFLQDKQVTRVSYAASFGCKDEREYTKKELEDCSLLAKKFDAISVRETSAIDICKRCFSIDSLVMPDPTFLLNKQDYEKLIEDKETSKYKGKIGYYFLEDTKQNFTLLHSLQQTTNLDIERIGQKQKSTPQTKDYTDCIFPSISEFFAGFRDSEYIITDSYHGMIFSIIFHKQFFIIDKKNVNIERIKHLLDIFPLKERFIDSSQEIDKYTSLLIDYETIDKQIEKMKREGKNFLNKYVVEKVFSK